MIGLQPIHPEVFTSNSKSTRMPVPVSSAPAHRWELAPPVQKVLRNTYALLSLSLLFSAGVAATGVALALPAPGLAPTLVGYFGLLFAVHRLRHSGWALPPCSALTGFMGYTLGPALAARSPCRAARRPSSWPWRPPAPSSALSAWVLEHAARFQLHGRHAVCRHGGADGRMAAVFSERPRSGWRSRPWWRCWSAGLILYQTSNIVSGGETNYVMATVGLFVSLFNLFTSLLSLFGFGGSSAD
jgi:modulator of FtsH protease